MSGEEESLDARKVRAIRKCLSHCGKFKGKRKVKYVTDVSVLKPHYLELLNFTAPYRPWKRTGSVVYRDYLGPRLEDHFMQYTINEPFEKFAPIVPLYIHWTEVRFGRVGGGLETLKRKLSKLLRKDVIYFTVTTDWTSRIAGLLRDFNILIASSKGDRRAHIILPHLFYYQVPGFNRKGKPIWNLDHTVSANETEEEEDGPVPKDVIWRFKRYRKYQQMPELTVNHPELRPKRSRMTFIGSLTTHAGRLKMKKHLTKNYPNDFFNGFFPVNSVCRDSSVVNGGASYCWRVYMLAGDVNLCPVGTAPVSYHLYEALQMGVIPLYIYDERGPFIPYKGTEADVGNLGYVTSFEAIGRVVAKEVMKLTEDDIRERRERILAFRGSHYTPKGAINQIKQWLQDPSDEFASDVRCCSNPI